MNKAIAFILGGVIGSGVTYFVMKNKQEEKIRQAQMEARDVYYSGEHAKVKETDSKNAEDLKTVDEKIITDYNTIAKVYRGTADDQLSLDAPTDDIDIAEKAAPVISEKYPDVITYEEFDTNGFATRSLVYHVNDVLTEYFEDDDENSHEEVVENAAELIGVDALVEFEHTHDDTIYVRNYALKTDFEIVYSAREFNVKPVRKRKASTVKEE